MGSENCRCIALMICRSLEQGEKLMGKISIRFGAISWSLKSEPCHILAPIKRWLRLQWRAYIQAARKVAPRHYTNSQNWIWFMPAGRLTQCAALMNLIKRAFLRNLERNLLLWSTIAFDVELLFSGVQFTPPLSTIFQSFGVIVFLIS